MFTMRKTLTATALALLVSTSGHTSDVLAKVNGKDITKTDLEQLEKSLPPEMVQRAKEAGDADNKTLLNQLIDLKILTDAAQASNVSQKPEVKKAIARAQEQVIVQAFVFEQLKSKVNDAAVEAKYSEFKDRFTKETKDKKEVKIRHILVKTEDEAKKIIQRLSNGEDFIKLARDLSTDKQSGQDGGDLGYMLEGTVKEFDEDLKAIAVGKVSKTPTKTQFGYHVFKIDDRRKAKVPAFKDVKRQLTAQVQQQAFMEMTKRLRDKASIEIIETKKG